MAKKSVHLGGISIIPVLVLFVAGVNCVEEAAPEQFLPPRNFNPHPYEINYDQRRNPPLLYATNQLGFNNNENNNEESNNIGNTGPVLFPSNPPETVANSNVQQQQQQPRLQFVAVPVRDAGHPIDRHPYAVVAKKKKYSLGLGRYNDEQQVNPQVYRGLAAHAQRVLTVPQAKDLKNVKIDPSFTNAKKDYAFSYKVVDHLTGDDFSHTQRQNSHATNGEYRVKLPDGRVQIVSYTADKNGYKADVKYDEETPKYEEEQVDQRLHNNPVNYGFYRPLLYSDGQALIYPENVRVVKFSSSSGGGGIHEGGKVGGFIGSTLAPYTHDDDGERSKASLATGLNKFGPVYIDASQLHYQK